MNILILLRHSRIWKSDVMYERYKSDGIVTGENISFMNLISAIAVELDKGVEAIINFDATTGVIMCVEGEKNDAKALNIIESSIDDAYYIPEIDVDKYISNTNNSVVEENHMYKDNLTLKAVMENYKVKNSFNFKVKRSDNKRKNSETFIVRYFNSEHTCPLRDEVLSKVQATVGFVSGVTAPKLGNHKRKHTPSDIIDNIREMYGVEISYQQAWHIKEHALKLIIGKPAVGYINMPRYIYMLETVYPNSYIRMHKFEYNEFVYLFISQRPMMRGFEFCRPVVVVDVSHLSGAYRGTFVSASTLNGAGCISPLANGIVDTENDCSWTWFFQQFKNAFGERKKMCVVSDKNESTKKGHLWKNVCSNFRRSKIILSDLFYSIAKAYRKDDFEKFMAKLDKIDGRVKKYLQDAGYEKWSKSHATVNRGRMMTSNIAECINGCLVDARQLPIIDFLEEVRILFGS
ncbi:uncharacterized protein [Solanum lycopersicum]|uniref:uncharacterized protein n=1 Tax=Solanum lycopersicum TaxID=4081 RepID=UPI0037482C33